MKNFITVIIILISFNTYSQAHIGISGAMDLENEDAKLGVGINYMLIPKVTLGAGIMITPFDNNNEDYEIMLNVKYNFGRFNLAAGVMDHEMGTNMGSMHHHSDDLEPYLGIDFKLFKKRKLKIFYNQSEHMKTLGLMLPVFNIGKKMKMSN
tara:strand:- start:4772 stop:5227 length:456 start_codon:yes stop_codon:yes gene_type:complete